MRQKPVNRFEANVVGVHVVRLPPAQFLHGGVRRRACAGRFGTDNQVLPVRFVPHGNDFDALLRSHDEGAQLRLCLVRKAVPHSQREFFKFHRVIHNQIGGDSQWIAAQSFRRPAADWRENQGPISSWWIALCNRSSIKSCRSTDTTLPPSSSRT